MPEEPGVGDSLSRSPLLMRPGDTGLLVIDVQQRLIDVIPSGRQIVWNCGRLIDGAQALGVATAATEQSPEKLGGSVADLAARLGDIAHKRQFSAAACGNIFRSWSAAGVHRVLLCGVETHVCVQQTALDLMAAGFDVRVAVDATGSRHRIDESTALRRLESCGATLTTTEAALFEWCEEAGTDAFRQISALVKQSPPDDTPTTSH